MAHKVLTLFWNLAHSDDVPTEIMDQALAAHVKILDYSCSQVQVICTFYKIFLSVSLSKKKLLKIVENHCNFGFFRKGMPRKLVG